MEVTGEELHCNQLWQFSCGQCHDLKYSICKASGDASSAVHHFIRELQGACAPHQQGCCVTLLRVSLCRLTIALAKTVPQGTNAKRKMFDFFCWFELFFYPSWIVPTVDSGQSEILERSIWNGCLYKAIMAVES